MNDRRRLALVVRPLGRSLTLRCAMSTRALRRGLIAIAVVAGIVAASPARADLILSCSAYSSDITCAAADVGKPCQGAGTCFAFGCSSGSSMTYSMVYRCSTCPTIVASDAGADGGTGCSIPNIGAPCAGGGICTDVPGPGNCNPTSNKYVCAIPYTGPEPTGPPAGENDAGADASVDGIPYNDLVPSSGCDVAPRPSPESLIGLGLIVIGVAFFVVDRKRARRRNR